MYQYQSNYDDSTRHSREVMRYFREVLYWPVEDHTGDLEAQRDGWDFKLKSSKTEFKDCNRIHQTGNMVFELVSNSRKATPGCMLTSKADILCYYDTNQHIIHLVNLPKLRAAIEEGPIAKWDAYKVTTPSPRTNKFAYATFGLLIPLTFIDKAGVWHETYHMTDLRTNPPASKQVSLF